MKHFISILLLLSSLFIANAAQKSIIRNVHPPHWWIGMTNNTLQLQVYGKDIKSADVSVKYPGVTLDSVVRLDSSNNYLFLYLTVASDTKPGKVPVTLNIAGKKQKIDYELRTRNTKGAEGFDASDVLYMIMPDRFANGSESNDLVKNMKFPVGATRDNLNLRHGGDLKGILDHVNYIDSLGVTAVWLNPVLENDMPGGSYHGYAITDYYNVDPRFGSNSDYAELVDTLHNRGIKTVMDMIFNHCGSEHIWFTDRPSKDWFNFPDKYVQTSYRLSTITDPYASDYDKKLSVDGWFVETMPDLNQRNPHLMKYLIQNSIFWIEEVGIDAIRMDTYPYADKKEMGKWIDAVLSEYPNFNIVGECWFAEPAGVSYWQKGSALASEGEDTNLPTVMDFPLMIKSRDMAPWRVDTDAWNGLSKIYDHLALDNIYADPMKLLRFLDNHDTERFILEEPKSLEQWKQAITMILTVPGIPQIYYGTELLMSGDRKPGDGNVRRDMPGGWKDDETDSFSAQGRSKLQNEAYDFISRLLQWRKTSKAISKGEMKHFAPDNGVYIYQRKSENERVIIIFNGTDRENEVDMSRYTEIITPGEHFINIITGEEVVPIPENGNIQKFDARCTMVLEPVK